MEVAVFLELLVVLLDVLLVEVEWALTSEASIIPGLSNLYETCAKWYYTLPLTLLHIW